MIVFRYMSKSEYNKVNRKCKRVKDYKKIY